jgi:DNA-binding transcriptional MerR regulator/methylmalonyl-CoA mutase cobalamin-binding subunit
MLSIGVVARQTGIEIGTLRKWETRYGFPKPLRRHSGHRYYGDTDVEKLLLVARRIAAGERVGQVIRDLIGGKASRTLIAQPATTNSPAAAIIAAAASTLLGNNVTGLKSVLEKALVERSVPAFVEEIAAPLTRLVGETWALGKLPIHGEHLYSSLLANVLALAANRSAATNERPKILLTTLTGEQHTLGLSMVHAVLGDAGVGSLMFPAGLPLQDIVAAAKAYRIEVVGLSTSFHYSPRMLEAAIRQLRAALPADVALWLGGSGMNKVCAVPAGTTVIATMYQLLDVCQSSSLLVQQPLHKASSAP